MSAETMDIEVATAARLDIEPARSMELRVVFPSKASALAMMPQANVLNSWLAHKGSAKGSVEDQPSDV